MNKKPDNVPTLEIVDKKKDVGEIKREKFFKSLDNAISYRLNGNSYSFGINHKESQRLIENQITDELSQLFNPTSLDNEKSSAHVLNYHFSDMPNLIVRITYQISKKMLDIIEEKSRMIEVISQAQLFNEYSKQLSLLNVEFIEE